MRTMTDQDGLAPGLCTNLEEEEDATHALPSERR
jgi:hypothetical protein